jgi:hypothetical protein
MLQNKASTIPAYSKSEKFRLTIQANPPFLKRYSPGILKGE